MFRLVVQEDGSEASETAEEAIINEIFPSKVGVERVLHQLGALASA